MTYRLDRNRTVDVQALILSVTSVKKSYLKKEKETKSKTE